MMTLAVRHNPGALHQGASRRPNSIGGFERSRKVNMRRDLECRLRAVEVAGSGGLEYWICQRDGLVRRAHGEQMTREEAEARARLTDTFIYFASETDARL
jgi:hypothetical protein